MPDNTTTGVRVLATHSADMAIQLDYPDARNWSHNTEVGHLRVTDADGHAIAVFPAGHWFRVERIRANV